jgi:DNA-binding PadR family transcriptional regulator
MKQPKIINTKGLLSFQVMHELNKKRLCGDDLANLIGKRKLSKLTPGTIYPVLKKLRDNKLIKMKQKGRKKTYFLTKKGEKEYKLAKKIVVKMLKGVIK